MVEYIKTFQEILMNGTVKLNQPIKNLIIIGDSYSTFEGYIPEGYAFYYSSKAGTDVR